jgi:flagellar basal body-associated protein FliL
MSKLDDIKAKIAGIRAQLGEKADKIAFLKSWREKRTQAAAAGPKSADPHSLGAIYREGGTGTRLQVLAFYLFLIVAVVSAGSLVRKMGGKMRTSAEHEKMVTDISHGLAETKHRHEEEAQLISLGQFTTNVYSENQSEKMMTIDLYVRVSDPQTGTMVNDRNEAFREKTGDALSSLYNEKVELLTEHGKDVAKERIRATLNQITKPGKVDEVFIQNLIVQ